MSEPSTTFQWVAMQRKLRPLYLSRFSVNDVEYRAKSGAIKDFTKNEHDNKQKGNYRILYKRFLTHDGFDRGRIDFIFPN